MLVGWLRAIIMSTRLECIKPADWCMYRWSIFVRFLGHVSSIEHEKQSFHNAIYKFRTSLKQTGPGSSVSIVTDYGLDGPGSNPSGDEIFRPSRPALGDHPASNTMGTGSFLGVK